jgi:TolB protein
MAKRLTFMAITFAVVLGVGVTRATNGLASGNSCGKASCFLLESTIALTSTRDAPTLVPQQNAAEVYLVDPDGTNPRRLTENASGDAFPVLSPDGKKIVFDSNRNRAETDPVNTSELFVMDTDGGQQTFVTKGTSATWSPDSKRIAYHASASGAGLPIKGDPGAATSDSDIFVGNLDDLISGAGQPTNITNTPDEIEDDADWSSDGDRLVFTSHPTSDNPQLSNRAEIYVADTDGGNRTPLTGNSYEERAPAWSPDGSRIVFSCRIGGGNADFEICVVRADGSGVVQLTANTVQELTANWSPDGTRIVVHRIPPFELWTMNADGTGEMPLTNTAGVNGLASWGELRVHQGP